MEKNIFFLKKSKHFTSNEENSLFINKLAYWICIFYAKNRQNLQWVYTKKFEIYIFIFFI